MNIPKIVQLYLLTSITKKNGSEHEKYKEKDVYDFISPPEYMYINTYI